MKRTKLVSGPVWAKVLGAVGLALSLCLAAAPIALADEADDGSVAQEAPAQESTGVIDPSDVDALSIDEAMPTETDMANGVGEPATKEEGADDGLSAASTGDYIPYPCSVSVYESYARNMLAKVNALRRSVGASDLTWDVNLEDCAIGRAAETTLYFSHTRPNGTMCWTAYGSNSSAGENIAMNWMQGDPTDVLFQGWKNSPGHYANMVNKQYKTIGISIVRFGSSYYAVQAFGTGSGTGMTSATRDGNINAWFPIRKFNSTLTADPANLTVAVGETAYLPKVKVDYAGTSAQTGYNYDLSGTATWSNKFFSFALGSGASSLVSVLGYTSSGYQIQGKARGTTTGTLSYGNSSSVKVPFTLRVTPWTRVYGTDQLDTMKAVSKKGWTTSSTVVIATQASYWDALAASSLAGKFDCPILLTDHDSLSSQASSEISRLHATKAYVVGGSMAVSDAVTTQVARLGCSVERVYGNDQQATAISIANKVNSGSHGDTCIIATANGFADALSASPYAYAKKSPIYLTETDSKTLSSAALDSIRSAGYRHAIIVGGTMAVDSNVESQLRDIAGVSDVQRKYGQTEYETSSAVAEWEVSKGMTVAHAGLATGAKFYDALAGGALCGHQNSVLVIASTENRSAIRGFLARNKSQIVSGNVFGGSAAVSEGTWEILSRATA
jgi:putative cell wall-binding protein/uncharacterized protein YkwD